MFAERPPGWTSLEWFFRVWASVALQTRDGKSVYSSAQRQRLGALGFALRPGRGSEAATFGFVRPLLTGPAPDSEVPEHCSDWFWAACCKTQYASIVSDAHLIRCHLLLVDLLEECARIGIRVAVRDETGYWETRSKEHLINEVGKMNRIVAAFAGRFHDAMPPGLRAEGAIFEHPEFERFESDGDGEADARRDG